MRCAISIIISEQIPQIDGGRKQHISSNFNKGTFRFFARRGSYRPLLKENTQMLEKEPVIAEAVEKLTGSKEAAENMIHSAEEMFTEGVKKGTDFIKKHPVESAAIGFGIGCLIGAWISKRNN